MARHAKHRPHQFVGQEEGDALAQWLNQWQAKKMGQSVAELLNDLKRLLQEMDEIGEKFAQLMKRKHAEAIVIAKSAPSHRGTTVVNLSELPSCPDYQKIVRRADRLLSQCSMRPRLMWQRKGIIGRNANVIEFGWHYKDARSEGLHRLVTVAKNGHLDRIRNCANPKCASWFFAKGPTGKYCSRDCQRRDYQTSEEWKKHRRKKHRENYHMRKRIYGG